MVIFLVFLILFYFFKENDVGSNVYIGSLTSGTYPISIVTNGTPPMWDVRGVNAQRVNAVKNTYTVI